MNESMTLNLRYLTDPERIRRVLPPLLEPDDEPVVMIFYSISLPEERRHNIFTADRFGESGFHVAAKYRGHRGMFQVGMPLSQDWGRTMGRETWGYHKKDGDVSLQVSGNTVRASVSRRGALIHQTETTITDGIAHPIDWRHEYGYGAFLYRFRLHPDWRRGPLSDLPVELWRLGGNDHGYPTEMEEGGRLPRACDVERTRLEFVDASPLDPFCEFPCRELLAVTFTDDSWEGDHAPPRRPPRPGSAPEGVGGPGAVFLEEVDKKAFEPWALHGYDRPIRGGKPWCPPNWPEAATAITVTEAELDAYRKRERIELAPVDLIDVKLEIDPQIHAKTLPPSCSPGNEATLRIMAMRVEASDLSPKPFNELWLFSRFELDGKPAYYALSDIVGLHGDVIFGRETFGYPSKMGEVKIEIGETEVLIQGRRMGRDFFRLKAALGPSAPAPPEEELIVVGLSPRPFASGKPLQADLVMQPWRIAHQGESKAASGPVAIELPETPGTGVIGRPDPWFEFQGCQVRGLTVSRVAVGRLPGRAFEEVRKFMPYFVERYDGVAGRNSAKMLAEGSKATFLTERPK